MDRFGSGEGTVGTSRVSVEVRSVNHRFFTPSIKLPSALTKLEAEVRESMRQRVTRGHITLSVRIGSDAEGGARIDEARVAAYAQQLTAIQERLGLKGPVALDALLRLPQVVTTEEVEAPTDRPEDILPVVRRALDEHDAMRAAEGAKLAGIILDRLGAIE